MPATVVVGTQWGDEGKGKLTDLCLVTWIWSFATRAVITRVTGSSSTTRPSPYNSCPWGLYPHDNTGDR